MYVYIICMYICITPCNEEIIVAIKAVVKFMPRQVFVRLYITCYS